MRCAMMATNFIYSLGAGITYPVVAVETYNLRLRANVQALGFTVQFVLPYMDGTTKGYWGPGRAS